MPLPANLPDYANYSMGRSSSAEIFFKVDGEAFPLPFPQKPRAIICGIPGTITLKDSKGNVAIDYPLQQGINAISPSEIVSLGTASDVWGLW